MRKLASKGMLLTLPCSLAPVTQRKESPFRKRDVCGLDSRPEHQLAMLDACNIQHRHNLTDIVDTSQALHL
jgi:hypothetical protein